MIQNFFCSVVAHVTCAFLEMIGIYRRKPYFHWPIIVHWPGVYSSCTLVPLEAVDSAFTWHCTVSNLILCLRPCSVVAHSHSSPQIPTAGTISRFAQCRFIHYRFPSVPIPFPGWVSRKRISHDTPARLKARGPKRWRFVNWMSRRIRRSTVALHLFTISFSLKNLVGSFAYLMTRSQRRRQMRKAASETRILWRR